MIYNIMSNNTHINTCPLLYYPGTSALSTIFSDVAVVWRASERRQPKNLGSSEPTLWFQRGVPGSIKKITGPDVDQTQELGQTGTNWDKLGQIRTNCDKLGQKQKIPQGC